MGYGQSKCVESRVNKRGYAALEVGRPYNRVLCLVLRKFLMQLKCLNMPTVE